MKGSSSDPGVTLKCYSLPSPSSLPHTNPSEALYALLRRS